MEIVLVEWLRIYCIGEVGLSGLAKNTGNRVLNLRICLLTQIQIQMAINCVNAMHGSQVT